MAIDVGKQLRHSTYLTDSAINYTISFHKMEYCVPFLGMRSIRVSMIVIGTDIVEAYFSHGRPQRNQGCGEEYEAWLAIEGQQTGRHRKR